MSRAICARRVPGRYGGTPIALESGARGSSYLPRVPDETRKMEERARFVKELREIGERVKMLV
ncbi:hypothetical protein VVT58_11670 [Sphingobium sp. SJ10-10]|uniref:hypothetical protein n=1 Tax=Sphingobium sp. SJ10-10 TaxID=3114999 RepID=UPI002E17007B|nr:hypothetical protein [Sphingobium sp. SJ10-10]